MTKEQFLDTFPSLCPPPTGYDWRQVPVEKQVLHTVKGSPHYGNVTPIITNGIHCWCIAPHKRVVHVIYENLQTVHVLTDKKPPKRTISVSTRVRKARTPRTAEEILNWFLQ